MNNNAPTVPTTLIYTIPDIDKNKKLSSYIATSLENKGIPCTSSLIDIVREKLNLHSKEDLTKEDIYNITTIVKQISERKQQHPSVFETTASVISLPTTLSFQDENSNYTEDIPAYAQFPDSSLQFYDNANESQPMLSEKPPSVPQTDESGIMETDVKSISTIVIVDSKDRNTEKWYYVNPFGVTFGYPSGSRAGDSQTYKGYLDKVISNVYEIELIEVIIPTSTYNGDNLATYPYLLLEIEELGSNFTGSNQYVNRSFAKISFFEQNGNYYYHKKDENNLNKKIFSPRISLNKLTFTLRTPDGTTVNVQPFIDESKKKKSHIVYTLNIKSYQRSLETIYIY